MDTNSQPVNAERVCVAGPTWLRVKSQVKAGGKQSERGSGADDGPVGRGTTRVPTWLRVKSQVKAGASDKPGADFGPGMDDSLPALRPRPSWLLVKSQLKAGSKDQDFGTPDDQYRVATRSPSWLRVKSQIKAGSDKGTDGFGSGDDAGPIERRVPTWLRVKSQVKAGIGKALDFGNGDSDAPVGRGTTRVPTWLQVKSQLRAGVKDQGFGPGAAYSLPASKLRPSWLLVKTQLRAAAGKVYDLGPGEDDDLTFSRATRVGQSANEPSVGPDAQQSGRLERPSWLRVKSEVRAGGPKPGFGQGCPDGPSSALSEITDRIGLETTAERVSHNRNRTEPQATQVPTWLRVKSQVKAGAKALDFGPGMDDSLPALRPRPSWLLVKSQLKAGSKDQDFGTPDDQYRVATRSPSWLRVKSQVKAGAKGANLGPGEDDGSLGTLSRPVRREIRSRSMRISSPESGELLEIGKHGQTSPTWLRVKTHIKAGPDGKGDDVGLGEDCSRSPVGPFAKCFNAPRQLQARPLRECQAGVEGPKAPTWLRVKTDLRAGGDIKPGFGQECFDRRSSALAEITDRIGLETTPERVSRYRIRTELQGTQAPTWLRVKSQVKAGSDKGGDDFGPGDDGAPTERGIARVPTWLLVKSQVKAGGVGKPLGFGNGDSDAPVGPGTTCVPRWLQVKSQLRAGSKGFDLGPCTEGLLPASTSHPSWLRVKSQLKAGAKDLDFGAADDQFRVTTLGPSWLRVKSQVKAGAKGLDFGGEAVAGPTWLQIKSGIKGGSGKEGGKGAPLSSDSAPPGSGGPSWLRVKSELRAGGIKPGFGQETGDELSSTLSSAADHLIRVRELAIGSRRHRQVRPEIQVSTGPAWLRVKSDLRAGGEPFKPGRLGGSYKENRSSTLARLGARVRQL